MSDRGREAVAAVWDAAYCQVMYNEWLIVFFDRMPLCFSPPVASMCRLTGKVCPAEFRKE